jgi:hypothetical protein
MKYSIIHPLLAAACLSLVAMNSYGQDVSKKEILAGQLLDQLNIEKMYEGAFASIPKMQEQMMGSQTKMSPDEKLKFQKQMQASMEAAKSALDWSTIKPIFVKIYADNFDETELDGLIAFYKTPVGQTWIDKQPQIQAATMQAMTQIMPKIQAAIMKAVMQPDIKAAAGAKAAP